MKKLGGCLDQRVVPQQACHFLAFEVWMDNGHLRTYIIQEVRLGEGRVVYLDYAIFEQGPPDVHLT